MLLSSCKHSLEQIDDVIVVHGKIDQPAQYLSARNQQALLAMVTSSLLVQAWNDVKIYVYAKATSSSTAVEKLQDACLYLHASPAALWIPRSGKQVPLHLLCLPLAGS